MKTKLSKNQKLILTVFTVLILFIKYIAFRQAFIKIMPMISVLYYIFIIFTIVYLTYIGKNLKLMNIIFAIECAILIFTTFVLPNNTSIFYVPLFMISVFILGSHYAITNFAELMSDSFGINGVWVVCLIYLLFSLIGILSKKFFQKNKR